MRNSRRIAKNTLFLIVSGLVTQAFGFFVTIYLARVLGPVSFGKINFAFAFTSYFCLLGDFGLTVLGVREIARDPEGARNFVGKIVNLRLVLAIISFIVLALLAFLIPLPQDTKILIIAYGLTLFPVAILLDFALQGMQRMEFIGIGRIISGVVSAGLVFFVVKGPNQMLLIPFIYVIATSIVAIYQYKIFASRVGHVKCRFNLSLIISLLQQAAPLGISLLLIQLIANIDTVMLGFMRGDAETGFYNASYRLIMPLVMLSSVYFDTIFPVQSKFYQLSIELLRNVQVVSVRLIFLLSLPVAVGGSILAGPIINTMYGPQYNESSLTLLILIWVFVLISINSIFARGLWAADMQKVFTKIVFIQALFNLLANFPLIHYFGMAGAAASTVFAELIGVVLYSKAFNQVVIVDLYSQMPKPFMAAMLMGVLVFAGLNLAIPWPLLVVAGAMIYMIILVLLKELRKEDFQMIRAILSDK